MRRKMTGIGAIEPFGGGTGMRALGLGAVIQLGTKKFQLAECLTFADPQSNDTLRRNPTILFR